MLKCLIVDDEEMAVRVIENYCSQIKDLYVVGTCQNAPDAFSVLQQQQVDLLFLDIQMPQMSGFGLLRTLPSPPAVILTTAHREFAMESYEYEVIDYLLKPVGFERFLKAVEKVMRAVHHTVPAIPANASFLSGEAPFIVIKSERQFVKILLDDILYIESIKNHVKVLTKKDNYLTLVPISDMEEKLPPQRFLRVHRSFIVAFSKIEQFTHASLTVGGHLIPIGDVYKNEVLKKCQQHLIG